MNFRRIFEHIWREVEKPVYIDNSIDYRGIKVDKLALENDKKSVDEFIDRLNFTGIYEDE
jgi:hypothetical protein